MKLCINLFSITLLAAILTHGVYAESTDQTGEIESLTSTSAPATPSKATEIYSSFNDEIGTTLHADSSALKPMQVPAELSETVEEIVLSFGASENLELEQNATEERYIVRALPREASVLVPAPPTTTEAPVEVSHVLEMPENETTDPTPTVRVATGDIPSFSEWTQKQLAERKKSDPNVTERVRSSKVRSKNYASPDCGAKIVAANQEAVSASSVLTSSRDEYMLNHCTARIWFIVELCEAVQAKQIDLANFELFSSSPKEFIVSIGTRFPSRDWSPVGQFTAQDSRDIQTFDLHPQLFGKYLKVELHSHYGKEHYCPLSWVRVFGTSEYEVLATEDDRHGDDDDDLADEEAGDAPRNLFSSATDVVLSIVKKATAPFMKSEEMAETVRAPPSACVSPRYLTVCNNCSQHTYDNVFYLLSCQQNALYEFIQAQYVRWILVQTDTCKKYGLNFINLREGAPFPLPLKPNVDHYLTALLKDSYIAALCNAMAVIESRVVVNMSLASPLRNLTVEPSAAPPLITSQPATSTCSVPNFSTSTSTKDPPRDSIEINPTKTLREEEVKNLVQDDTSVHSQLITATASSAQPSVSSVLPSHSGPYVDTAEAPKVSFVEKPEEEEIRANREPDASLDAILKDLSELEKVVNESPSTTTSSAPPQASPKDSIFLRLANRIKALELNMSLSGSYLEELSRRYRLQSEMLGQTVNATAVRLEQHVRMEEIKNRRRDDEISSLKEQLQEAAFKLQRITAERDSWLPRPSQMLWLALEIAILAYYLRRRRVPEPAEEAHTYEQRPPVAHVKSPRRRNSVECVTGHVLPNRPLERRPSDEALEITVSTNYSTADRKRKKKRKDTSRKSSAAGVKRKREDLPNGPFGEGEDMENGVCGVTRQMSEPPPAGYAHDDSVAGPREALATSNRFAAFASPEAARHPQLVRRFSSPAFMRTAMSSRVSRSGDETIKLKNLKKESGFKKYMRKLF